MISVPFSTEPKKASEFEQENDKSTSHPPAHAENKECKVANDIARTTNISSEKGELDHKKHSSKSNYEEEAGIMKKQDVRASKTKAFNTETMYNHLI